MPELLEDVYELEEPPLLQIVIPPEVEPPDLLYKRVQAELLDERVEAIKRGLAARLKLESP